VLTEDTVLKAETETCMRLLGAKSVAGLGPKFVSILVLSQLGNFILIAFNPLMNWAL
jgi:hypothetical protein